MLLVLILIIFPMIFGAGIGDIALVWAPWSFLAGLVVLALLAAGIVIRLSVVMANEVRAKAG